MYIYHGVPYPWYEVHILIRSYEKTSFKFGIYVTKWDVGNSSRISSILIIFAWFWKKTFLSRVIFSVNRRRKDTKVTFVSFGLHAGRFIVECKKYGNKLFSYFDIFIYVSSNFFFTFKNHRVFAVSNRLAASHLLYQFWFG